MKTTDVIDIHAHLALPGTLYKGHEATADDLIQQMEMNSVDLAVVLAVASDKEKEYNDFIADTVQEFPDRFIGFGSVHPQNKNALKELDRFQDLGLQGVKIHPVMQNIHCDTPKLYAVAKKCADINIPVLIHSYFPHDILESERLYKLVTENKDTTFILAHMGGHRFLDCISYMGPQAPNVYFDISSVSFMFSRSPYAEQVVWLIQKIGVDRVMFGSNYPVYDLADALAAFDDLGLSFEESQHVLGKTAADLLKL